MTAEQHRGAAAIVRAVQRYGSDADHLRDAAHEACHALEVDVPRGHWGRETIHEAIMSSYKKRSSAVTRSFQLAKIISFEITARAVERIVCEKFSIDIGDPEYWAGIACIEAVKVVGVQIPSVDWFLAQVKKAESTDRVKKLIERIVALGSETVKPLKPMKPMKKERRA